MSDVTERLAEGKLRLWHCKYGKYYHADDEDNAEILRLATLASTFENNIKNCSKRVQSCFVRSCPGRNFCDKYKAKESDNNAKTSDTVLD